MILLAITGFLSIFTVSLSTRSINRDSYWNAIITSILAGSVYWWNLGIVVNKLRSLPAGIVYVTASTAGRIFTMWLCSTYIEDDWQQKLKARIKGVWVKVRRAGKVSWDKKQYPVKID